MEVAKVLSVKVRLLGGLKEVAGWEEREVEWRAGDTVASLIERSGLNPQMVVISLVNGAWRSKDAPVEDGAFLKLADSFSGG